MGCWFCPIQLDYVQQYDFSHTIEPKTYVKYTALRECDSIALSVRWFPVFSIHTISLIFISRKMSTNLNIRLKIRHVQKPEK